MENLIVVVDYNWGGHHPTYHARFVAAALPICTQVLSLSPDPDDAKAKFLHLGLPSEERVSFRKLSYDLAKIPIRRKIPSLSNLELFKGVQSDISAFDPEEKWEVSILFCCMYHGAWPLWIRETRVLRHPWSALIIDSNLCCKSSPVTQLKKFRSTSPDRLMRSPSCTSLMTFEHEYAGRIERATAKPVYLLPDYCEVVEDGEVIANQFDDFKKQSSTKKIIGVFGTLTPRKAVLELLRAARMMSDRTWVICIAGELKSDLYSERELMEIEDYFKTHEDCLFLEGHIVNESTYNYMVSNVDVLFLYYKNFEGSSGNLAKAIHFNKIVLSSDQGCIGMRVNQYGLGKTISSLSPSDVEEAISEVLTMEEYSKDPTPLKLAHSLTRFDKVVQESLNL